MGFESRDYSRDGSYSRSFSGLNVNFTPVVKYIILANVVVFLLQIFITKQVPMIDQFGDPTASEQEREFRDRLRRELPAVKVSVVTEWLELTPSKTVEGGQIWRLITCAFCHDRLGIWHILFNMLLLYWFGTRLESQYGSREFLLFYLVAALCSSLAFLTLAYYQGSDIPAIGASGAVMAVMMLYTIFHPHETILLFWIVPVPLWVLLAVYILFDLHPVLLALAGERLFTGVAHAAHLGGLAFGFLYWKFDWRLENIFAGKFKRKPRVKLYAPPPERGEALDDKLDAVLKKISEQGQDSLTSEERDVLTRASTRFRKK